MKNTIIIPEGLNPGRGVSSNVEEFLNLCSPFEVINGGQLSIYYDEKSEAYYLVCHLQGRELVSFCDLNAGIDVGDEEDTIYRLNRDITEDETAYKNMVEDALNGRSFEDMVVEYDTSYCEDRPLKVYGGQHRIKAISQAIERKGHVSHGIRVYFNLTRDQKVEIATINNTAIVVPNDLIDRMREQLLGSELRTWSQQVGLLNSGEDFADRKKPVAPTVRIVRTIIVNYFRGLVAKEDDFHQPIVCKSGGLDDDYMEVRNNINWDDENFLAMGKQYAHLHKKQRDIVTNREKDNLAEFARKAFSLAVVSSWAYAAGFFQSNPDHLRNHYMLTESAKAPYDPLNATALSRARHKGIDPDTYRGLGTRVSANEIGRMLEVFIIQATKAADRGITPKIADAAIASFEAKRAKVEAEKKLGKI